MPEEQCLRRRNDIVRGHDVAIGERLLRDLDALIDLPAVPHDAREKVGTRAMSISMVGSRNNDYSVPVADAHHEVQIRGYVHEVVIGCGPEGEPCRSPLVRDPRRTPGTGDPLTRPI